MPGRTIDCPRPIWPPLSSPPPPPPPRNGTVIRSAIRPGGNPSSLGMFDRSALLDRVLLSRALVGSPDLCARSLRGGAHEDAGDQQQGGEPEPAGRAVRHDADRDQRR